MLLEREQSAPSQPPHLQLRTRLCSQRGQVPSAPGRTALVCLTLPLMN